MQCTTFNVSLFPLLATSFGLTVLLASPSMMAQTPKSTDTTLHQTLVSLRPGTAVRVSRDLSRVEGTVQRLTRHDMVLAGDQAEHTLALGEVDTLWVSRRGQAGKGALIGGLAGLGIGLIAGAIAAPEGSTDTPKGANALIGGGIGLLGGAFLGLLVGAEARYWDRTYPQAHR
jgi:hypothetical protein